MRVCFDHCRRHQDSKGLILILDVNLVGGLNPSEKYESLGMIIPNIWKNQIHVPNHQPEMMALFLIVSNQQFLIEQLRAGGKAQIERNIESPCDGIF